MRHDYTPPDANLVFQGHEDIIIITINIIIIIITIIVIIIIITIIIIIAIIIITIFISSRIILKVFQALFRRFLSTNWQYSRL